MATESSGLCEVCGKPGNINLNETFNGEGNTRQRTFCLHHAPPQLREQLPFGPHRTSAEEVEFLRQKLLTIDQQVAQPALRAKMKEQVEQLIVEVEAARRRVGDE